MATATRIDTRNSLRVRRRALFSAVAIWLLFGIPATAGVTVDVGLSTLNEVLTELTIREVQVPLGQGAIDVELANLEITGFDPAAGERMQGYVLASLEIVAVDVGVRLKIEPRISLRVVRDNGESSLELRYEEVPIELPLMGQIDIARLVPPQRFPADAFFSMEGARGDVELKSSLNGIRMGREAIRFEFDLEVLPAGER
ncbi:MAG: hypothetical protein GY716_01045 [bacterium]|nr:hypothetical protein [bacterium]